MLAPMVKKIMACLQILDPHDFFRVASWLVDTMFFSMIEDLLKYINMVFNV